MTPAQQKAVHLADEILKSAGLPTYTKIQHGLQVLDEYCELEAGDGPDDLASARIELQQAAYAFRDPDLGEVDHPEDVPAAPPQHVIEAALRRVIQQGTSTLAAHETQSSAQIVEPTEDAVGRMTAAIKQMFPEISPARCAATARTLHADHGSVEINDGDIVTIYIAPSRSRGLPAPMGGNWPVCAQHAKGAMPRARICTYRRRVGWPGAWGDVCDGPSCCVDPSNGQDGRA